MSFFASEATVWFSYRSCGVISRPSLAALIAMLIAISESPPISKKLAVRSTLPTPRHCAQIRASVASIGVCPVAEGALESAAVFSASIPCVPANRAAALCSTQCRSRANG
ncbi:Uncharacterised protein [Mycobacteroides abscessus subsp. abscessus]|nr:Uncharacterised protein [Mycobacteroides abscessus subsp. abscessus]